MATRGTVTLESWRTRLARFLGQHQSLTPVVKDTLDECIQAALREVYAFEHWEFLEADYRIELQAAEDAGTVSVAAGGTAWTGTGTAWDTGWSAHVRIRCDGEVYRVASIDSQTALTSTDAALAALTGKNYLLYVDRYSLSSEVESVSSLHVKLGDRRLGFMSAAAMASHKAMGAFEGHPAYFSNAGLDASGNPVIELYPIPGTNEILHVRGYKTGTVPTADAGTSDVPDRYQETVLAGARMRLYELHSDPRHQAAATQFYGGLARMVSDHSVMGGPMRLQLDPDVHGPAPTLVDVVGSDD